MLPPKEKAKELLHKINNTTTIEKFEEQWQSASDYAKRNLIRKGLIVVDEIIEAIDWHYYETPNNEIEYWQQVKHELNKSE